MVGERYALLRYGGAGAASTLICGVVRFQHHTAHNLIGLLPPIICVDSFASLNSDWMQTTLQLMAFEARQPSPGGETIVTRLADIFVIQAIRSWLQRDPAAKTGWLGLGAVQDRQVGRALAVIHREPANDWSVESLATVAAMSRSGFAARFSALVGQTPMHYVTNVRMRVANELLTTEKGLTIGEVAARLRLSVGGRFQPRIQAFQWQNTRGLQPRKLELGCGTTPASSEKICSPRHVYVTLRLRREFRDGCTERPVELVNQYARET